MASRKFFFICAIAALALSSSPSFGKSCAKVYSDYLKIRGGHKALATSGGVPISSPNRPGFSCNATSRALLSDAKRAAIARCQIVGAKNYDSRACIVIMSQ
jgi:hypothetical protein